MVWTGRHVGDFARRHKILTALVVLIAVPVLAFAVPLLMVQQAYADVLTPDNVQSYQQAVPGSYFDSFSGTQDDELLRAQMMQQTRYDNDLQKMRELYDEEAPSVTGSDLEKLSKELDGAVEKSVKWSPSTLVASTAGRAVGVLAGAQLGYQVLRDGIKVNGHSVDSDGYWCTSAGAAGAVFISVLGGDCGKVQAQQAAVDAVSTVTNNGFVQLDGGYSLSWSAHVSSTARFGNVCSSPTDQCWGSAYSATTPDKLSVKVQAFTAQGNGAYDTETVGQGNWSSYPYDTTLDVARAHLWTSIKSVSSHTIQSQSTWTDKSENPGKKRISTKVTCRDGSTKTVSGMAADSVAAMTIPAEVEIGDDCEPTGISTGMEVSTDNGASWAPSTAPTTDAIIPDSVQQWQATYPQCVNGGCKLDLMKTLPSGTKVSCFDEPNDCTDAEDQLDDGTYTCRYADEDVAISECNGYKPLFDKDNLLQGKTYADPKTGVAQDVQTAEGVRVAGEAGVESDADRAVQNQEVTDPDEQHNDCFPTGWAVFNPINWVLQPVQCALKWAFVPRASKIEADVKGMKDSWKNTPPGVIAGVVAGIPSMMPQGGSACKGPHIHWDWNLIAIHPVIDADPLDSCSGTGATLAAISLGVVSGLTILGTIFALTRIIGNVVNTKGIGSSEGGGSS